MRSKKAVLVRGCPEPLKTHLQMNLQTYVSHGSIRNAVPERRVLHLRQARTRTERLLVQGCKRRKSKRQGQRKGKAERQRQRQGQVGRCEVSQEDSQSSNNSQIVANFTSDWIFAVTWAASLEEIYESEVEIFQDSGAYDHVCSPEFANHSPLLPRLDTGTVCNAHGSEIPTHGRRVRLRLEGASVEFQVMNVKRCIFNIGRLIEQGFRIDFERQVFTGPDGRQAQLHRQGTIVPPASKTS